MSHLRKRLAVMLLVAPCACACIPIPVMAPQPYTEEVIGSLSRGATRADVLYTLGAPAFVHDDERLFVYSDQQAHAFFIIILGRETQGGVGGGGLSTGYLFVVQFDADGVIEQQEVLSLGMGLGIATASGGENVNGTIGHEDVVCTSWQLCLGNGGARSYPPPAGSDGTMEPN